MSTPSIDKSKVASSISHHYGETERNDLNTLEKRLVKKAINFIDRESRGVKRRSDVICGGNVGGNVGGNGDQGTNQLDSTDQSSLNFVEPDVEDVNRSTDNHIQDQSIEIDEENSVSNDSNSMAPPSQLSSSTLSPIQLENNFQVPIDDVTPTTSGAPPPSSPIQESSNARTKRVRTCFTFETYKTMLESLEALDTIGSIFERNDFHDQAKFILQEIGDPCEFQDSAFDEIMNVATELIKALFKDMHLRCQFEGRTLASTTRNMVLETLLLWKLNQSPYFENISNILSSRNSP